MLLRNVITTMESVVLYSNIFVFDNVNVKLF